MADPRMFLGRKPRKPRVPIRPDVRDDYLKMEDGTRKRRRVKSQYPKPRVRKPPSLIKPRTYQI